MQFEITPSLIARFWPKVEMTSTCWLWTASAGPGGYGQINQGGQFGRPLKAHRVSWVIHNGPIPDALFVCHGCDTPACVNPAHLFLGTAADNARDCSRKGRHSRHLHPEVSRGDRNPMRQRPERAARGDHNGTRLYPESVQRGEKHQLSKLTAQSVTAIRQNYTGARGQTSQLARDYGVSRKLISLVVARKSWAHIH